MMSVARTLLSLTLALVVALPLLADDKEKKAAPQKPEAGAAILKRLEKVGLTEEQTAKIKELAAQTEAKQAGARPALSDEQRAKLAEAKKAGETKDIKALWESVLTAEQKQAMEAAKAAQGEMMKQVLGMLTDDQRAKLAPPKDADRKAMAEKRAAEAKKHAEARKAEAEKRRAAAEKAKAAEAKKDGEKKPAAKQDGEKKPAVKQDGEKKPAVKQDGEKKPAVKQDGEKQPAADKPTEKTQAIKKVDAKKPCCEKAAAAGEACKACAAKKPEKKD